MPTFAVNRQSQNRGCGVRSGAWLFEEFMFGDSCFGRVEIEYTPIGRREFDILGESEVIFDPEDVQVTNLVIFDDDGNDIPLSDEDRQKACQIALDAFAAIKDDVREFENERADKSGKERDDG